VKTICILGSTGVGKSSVANSIIDSEYFNVSSNLKSETSRTEGVMLSMNFQGGSFPVVVIDTPGFDYWEGRDPVHVVEMVCALKMIRYVNTFVLCFNSEDPRLDENKQSVLKILIEMFGVSLFENALICLTKWSIDKKSNQLRNLGKKINEE
jgi:GTPase SAR1 family protein